MCVSHANQFTTLPALFLLPFSHFLCYLLNYTSWNIYVASSPSFVGSFSKPELTPMSIFCVDYDAYHTTNGRWRGKRHIGRWCCQYSLGFVSLGLLLGYTRYINSWWALGENLASMSVGTNDADALFALFPFLEASSSSPFATLIGSFCPAVGGCRVSCHWLVN
jgi:hypothetical protein